MISPLRRNPDSAASHIGSVLLGLTMLGSIVLLASPAFAGPGFVENRGQVDARVLYYVPLGGTTAFFTADGIVFDLRAIESTGARDLRPHSRGSDPAGLDEDRLLHGHAVALRFTGRSETMSCAVAEERASRLHYFVGSSAAATDVRLYDELTLHDVWPGIDLVFSADRGLLRYAVRARAGADAASVSMQWEGASIDNVSGEVALVETSAGTLRFSRTADGGCVEVLHSGTANPDPANSSPANPVNSGPANSSPASSSPASSSPVPLHSGPASSGGTGPLHWSSFLGGTSDEIGWCLALDGDENVIVTGLTLSVGFPTTIGAYDTSYNQFGDVFVSKLSADGSSLLWSTYLGGSGTTYFDYGYAVTLDGIGRPVVVGYTGSTNFPTTAGAYDRTHNGGVDVFVAKLAADGSALLFSTFVGDVDHDIAYAVTLDGSDNVVFSGRTLSPNFPTTDGAYDRSPNGEEDGFVAKLESDGSALVWSTLVGGSLYDGADVVLLDGDDRPTVVGYTASFDFPTTSGAHDPDWNGGLYDAFALELEADGTALLWSTYVGGSETDFANGLALDASGDPILVGETGSFDFPTTPSAYDESFNGADDAYATKLSGEDGTLVWSTFLGGTVPFYETAFGVDVDAFDRPVVAGTTPADDFPVLPGGYDTSHNGGQDVFLSLLESDGSALLASTFLGGTGTDYAWFARFAANGDVVVTGDTGSTDFPTTPEAYDPDYNGSDQDVWVARLSLESDPTSTPWPESDATLSLIARPNPAIGAVHFEMPAAATGTLRIVDPAGRVVARFDLTAADRFAWDGTDRAGQPAPAGVYLAILDGNALPVTSRFLLLR